MLPGFGCLLVSLPAKNSAAISLYLFLSGYGSERRVTLLRTWRGHSLRRDGSRNFSSLCRPIAPHGAAVRFGGRRPKRFDLSSTRPDHAAAAGSLSSLHFR